MITESTDEFTTSSEILSTEDLYTILNIDKLVYPKEFQSNIRQLLDRHNKYNNSYTTVKYKDKIIGYVCCFPIDENIRTLDLVNDFNLTSSSVNNNDNNKEITLYIISIAIIPEFQNTNAIKVLLEEFIRDIREKINQGHKIKNILAIPISESGFKILHKLGFNKYKDIEENLSLFSLEMLEKIGGVIL